MSAFSSSVRIQEPYCRDCPAMPRSSMVEKVSQTITGCPHCSSIQNAFHDRTVLDAKMSQFYMTTVINNPKIDTNLLTLKFEY